MATDLQCWTFPRQKTGSGTKTCGCSLQNMILIALQRAELFTPTLRFPAPPEGTKAGIFAEWVRCRHSWATFSQQGYRKGDGGSHVLYLTLGLRSKTLHSTVASVVSELTNSVLCLGESWSNCSHNGDFPSAEARPEPWCCLDVGAGRIADCFSS